MNPENKPTVRAPDLLIWRTNTSIRRIFVINKESAPAREV